MRKPYECWASQKKKVIVRLGIHYSVCTYIKTTCCKPYENVPHAHASAETSYTQRSFTMVTNISVDNGVNTQALLDARAALSASPRGAQFTWRATCMWIYGTHSRSTVQGFYGLGAEQQHKTAFTFDADHPELFASADHGATPVELVLAGLASCLTAGVASVAQLRGIQLRSVTATLEGDMDILGILGADTDARNGFNHIKVTFAIDADATPEEIRALVAQSQKRSAVYDIITNPTNVTVEVA
jgi:uncharacterized OsmC-like protein